MEYEVTCPSGLSGKIRALKVSDEPMTRDPKLLKSGKVVYELCNRCWVETTDPGPYLLEKGVPINWENLLQGDAFWVFLQIRKVTYGDAYDFQYQCNACAQRADYTMLFSDLELQEPSEDALASFVNGTAIHDITDDGVPFTFSVITGKDESRISNFKKGKDLSHARAVLATRIISVNGQELTGPAKARWVEGLTSGMADEISDIMESHDCGVDTDLEVQCNHCGNEQTVVLPLGPTFFKRKSLTKKERRAKRAQQKATQLDTSDSEETG